MKKRIVGLLLTLSVPVSLLVAFPVSPTQAKSFCDHTGGNSHGRLLPLHVDPTTHLIVDNTGCQIMLRGVNIMIGGGQGGNMQILTNIDDQAANGHVDVMRVNFNAYWYQENVMVPNLSMYYRDWVDMIIKNNDAHGVYTELDKGEQFTEPPCVGNGDFCPGQPTGGHEAKGTPDPGDPDPNDPNAWQEASDGSYMLPAMFSWSAIASKYANDPGVLYDTWNESHDYVYVNPSQWEANQNAMINLIRSYAPNSLIIYYAGPDVKEGIHYHQPNLVEDTHIYDTGFVCSTFQAFEQQAFADEHAVIINEWGNPNGALTEPYNTNLNTCATSQHAGLIYYTLGYLYSNKGTLLPNGLAYEQDNANAYATYK